MSRQVLYLCKKYTLIITNKLPNVNSSPSPQPKWAWLEHWGEFIHIFQWFKKQKKKTIQPLSNLIQCTFTLQINPFHQTNVFFLLPTAALQSDEKTYSNPRTKYNSFLNLWKQSVDQLCLTIIRFDWRWNYFLLRLNCFIDNYKINTEVGLLRYYQGKEITTQSNLMCHYYLSK